MTQTVASVLSRSGMLALDHALSQDLLAQSWPEVSQEGTQAAADDQLAAVAPERFHIERGVAVVPIRGVLTPNSLLLEKWLGWTTYRGLEETCATLAEDETVKTVVLDVNSGGGMVVGLRGAAAALSALAAVKTVQALVDPVAASAAYWLASQASEISMTKGAVVGSIGVGMGSVAYVQPGSSGGQFFEFTSTHARAKWPDPTTEEGRAEILRSLDETEAEFHAAVATARGIPIGELTQRLSVTEDPRDGGAVFGPEAAIKRGLADRTETRAAFYARILGPRTEAPKRGRAGRAAIARAQAAQAVSTI